MVSITYKKRSYSYTCFRSIIEGIDVSKKTCLSAMFLTASSMMFMPMSLAKTSKNLQLFFNHPSDYAMPESRCSSNLCGPLLDEINSAKESIDFAIYGLRGQKAIYNAILAAKKEVLKSELFSTWTSTIITTTQTLKN